ncbi:hypothetical protein [Halobellus salinisoli]|uniref:hypothetical protein n=1 Tax=Halobellus salinisoli TaxID=3108500 RepID=UPI00300A1B2B
MSVLDTLRRWWELNVWFFGRLHSVADVIAGIAFVLLIPLGVLLFQRPLGLTIPLPDGAAAPLYYAFIAVVAVFAVAVLLQTIAALRAFFMKVHIQILDFLRE